MNRYYLQEGDGAHVGTTCDLMLVMSGGDLALSDFDVDAVDLSFHWNETAYPVRHDANGFYVEVDEDIYHELRGAETAHAADGPPAGPLDLLDCLEGDAVLAARVREAVIRARPEGWRGDLAKERAVKQATHAVVGDIATTERVFRVIEADPAY